jgi:c-di-AMP phosphodiesterase-like protein
MEILEGGIAITAGVLPAEGQSTLALAQVADGMLNLDGVKSSFALGQMGEEVTVSARSSGRVNVQLIMEELGGGGHQTVAGVKIKKVQIDELKAQIIELVKKQMEESEAGESDSAAR